MEVLTNDLFKKALGLNEKDRAALAGLLIESLDDTPIEEIESVRKAEVAKRVKELDSGEVTAILYCLRGIVPFHLKFLL